MMKKITNPVSGAVLNFRAARVAAVSAAVITASIASTMLSTAARAQGPFVGNAYAVQVKANLLGDTINVGTKLNSTENLHPTTQQTLTGLTVGVDVKGSVIPNFTVPIVGNVLKGPVRQLVTADVNTVSTTSFPGVPPASGNIVVTSISSITNLNLFGSNTFTPSVAQLLAGLDSLINVGLDIRATAVESQTDAFFNGMTQGRTTITDLTINGQTQILQLDAQGNIATQTIQLNILPLLGGLTNIGSLTLNEQIINSDKSQTTNAIHLSLLGSGTSSSDSAAKALLGNLAGTDVIVASSTAGAAPEPGSLALLGASLLPIFGLMLRQRRRHADPTLS